MTNQDILTKAIEKAIDGGWPIMYQKGASPYFSVMEGIENDWTTLEVTALHPLEPRFSDTWYVKEFIFNHDFAKSLWPKHDWDNETTFCTRCGVSMASTAGYPKTDCFYEMLQQMVIAEDPIKYLGDNL